MAQPSIACFFNNRKRTALEDSKINQARKVLILDSNHINGQTTQRLQGPKSVIVPVNSDDGIEPIEKITKLQEKEERLIQGNKIVGNISSVSNKPVPRKVKQGVRSKKVVKNGSNMDILQLFNNINEKKTEKEPLQTEIVSSEDVGEQIHKTPPITPSKKINAMDKVKEKPDGPSLKEIKRKMTRSARLNDLKASISRFQEGANKLKEIEKKTSQIQESPKLKTFKTIELEVHTSPQKSFTPEKAYLSPKKELGARRNLFSISSPTKNAISALPQSPSKKILDETLKPALTLPFKYRYLAEIFRAIDTVSQILHNRKETITFQKLKPAVEQMMKRNLMERHLAQIKNIYPDAYTFQQEKLKVFGNGMRNERWELVLKPNIDSQEHMTSEILLERKRKLFNILLDKVKDYHQEFLMSLDTPLEIPKDKITRWHPEFDIEMVPDIEQSEIPKPPAEEKLTTGKDVLEKARVLFNCNTRMEQALQRLKEAREAQPQTVEKPEVLPNSVLKGIPKALLDKVRQKQAAKALLSMTRSADKEKELQIYSRLPELSRLTRNVFVTEKKSVLLLDILVQKLLNCYRGNLNKTEMEQHLQVISKEVPGWLVFHEIRNSTYVKLSKNADLSLVINKLENLTQQKSES